MKKRLFLAVIISFIASIATAQVKIQDTFFGATLGDSFTEARKDVKHFYKNRFGYWNKHYFDKNNLMHDRRTSVSNADFGGRRWQYMDFYFDSKDMFYKTRAYCAYKKPDAAKEMYDSVLKDLKYKYGAEASITVTESGSWGGAEYCQQAVFTDGERECSIIAEYTSSRSGDMFYYVFLIYKIKGIESPYLSDL